MVNKKIFGSARWVLPAAGVLALLFTLYYGSAGPLVITFCLLITETFEYFFRFRDTKGFSPYWLLLLTPLLLLKYSSVTDFRIRVVGFVLLAFLISAAYARASRKIKFSLLRAKPVVVWLIAFAVFSLASVAITLQGVHLSGDEPHYIMIAQSLTEDGDFDLKNNIEEKTYLNYLPIEVRFHGGEYNGKFHSFHLPGLSFLLIPFYWLFKVSGIGSLIPPPLYFRLAASIINAFFALCLFYLLKMKFPDKEITGFWLLVLVTFPLIFHGNHLYPELPAATLMMAAYLFSFGEKKNYLGAGLFLSLIPWFHVKYIPPLGILGLAILYEIFKPLKPFRPFEKEKITAVVKLAVFPLLVFGLLVIYSKTLYGALSPTNIFPKESYWSVPWLLRLKVFLAYFLDQRDGLLFYSPLFFLFFFSFKNTKKLDRRFLLLGIAVSYVFFHAFTTVRGAYSPAGRPLMSVSWIFILFIAHFYFNIIEEKTFFSGFVFKLLAGLGVFVLAWLFYYPLFVYQPVFAGTTERASGLNLFLGSDFVHLWELFPSFLTSPKSGHPATFAWIGVLAVLLLFYYSKRSTANKTPVLERGKAPATVMAAAVFLLFAGIYSVYPHVHLINQNKHTDKTISFYNNSKNFKYMEEQKGFRIKAGNDYDIYIDRKMLRQDKVTFRFTHTDATAVTVRNGKQVLFRSSGKKQSRFTLDLSQLKTLNVKNKLVSHIGIETVTGSKTAFLWLEME